MADTAAIQALLDAVPSTGGRVYLPAQTYVIDAPLRVGPATLLCGDGYATVLQAALGATFPNLLVNRDPQSRRIRLSRLYFDGNKANGAVCGGIGWDHTGFVGSGSALHRLFDVRVGNCAGNGVTLTKTRSVSVDGLHCEANDGHGLRIDGTSYDGHYANLIIGNSGLHNIWASAGTYFDSMHSYWSGKVDPVNFGDGLFIDGWATYGMVRGKIEDSFRHGLHIHGLGLPAAWYGWNIDVAFSDIEGAVVKIGNAYKTLIRATAGGATRHRADAILSMTGGIQNVIDIRYAADMAVPNPAIQGDTTGNCVSVRAF